MKLLESWLDLRRGCARRAWALICLLLFVGLQFASVSDQLHDALHADTHHADHTCVVKLLSQGQVDAPDPVVLILPATLSLPLSLVLEPLAFSSVEYLLQFGRAPPPV
jgi:hypothetical protein